MSISTLTLLLLTLTLTLQLGNSQLSLNSVEQESVYRVLESLNPDISWRTLFPEDLCSSAPHGILCDYITTTTTLKNTTQTTTTSLNIVGLSFGYVSDYNPNPSCKHGSNLPDPNILQNFPYLKKLFFYQCFMTRPVLLSDLFRVGSGLEEVVFIDNPSLYGSLSNDIGKMVNLRRLIITGSNISGEIPAGFSELKNLEEATLSRNGFTGKLPENFEKLKNVKVLDFSQNGFLGKVPESIGSLENLIKLDLSENGFSGEIPASMEGLRVLEFLDLSFNKFSNGVPLFLGNLSKLKGVYLSGNELGGVIPDIWEKLKGVNGIGLSNVGLIGEIPSSMGVFLGNLSYLGLDNNKLQGSVPMEFEKLEFLNELNLRNNNLSGRVPFSAKFVGKVGKKLRLDGNPELCVDQGVIKLFGTKVRGDIGKVKVCDKVEDPISAFVYGASSSSRVGYHVYCLLVLFIFLW
ncbi:piriformospora indica-insensitive protein 2 [Tanacetum coccineum]